jgi:Tfp pilus assembly protein PilF
MVVYATNDVTNISVAKIVLKGLVKFNCGKKMERIDKLRQMLASSPDDSFLNHAMAMELMAMGQEAEARSVLQTLLQRDPGYIGSYYQLAKLLERLGERDAALEWYEKGLSAAQKAGDRHAMNELRMAYDELLDE